MHRSKSVASAAELRLAFERAHRCKRQLFAASQVGATARSEPTHVRVHASRVRVQAKTRRIGFSGSSETPVYAA